MENDCKKWKIIDSDYIIKRPWLTARKDKVELFDGRIIEEYYVFEYPDWVNVIAITKEGEFVMEKQYRHGLGVHSIELPCGVAEKGESPIDAAKRELLEETGYGNGEWSKLMTIAPNPGSMNNLTHCFLAVGVEKISNQSLDDTEELTVHLMSKKQIKQLLDNDQICQSLMVAPLYKYFNINNNDTIGDI
ncbi:MAG: NUDIX hydrolase [Bacteroidaceae bacterium]|nr:NUDIX hydrolase [Bacteroidaceae bacterium]